MLQTRLIVGSILALLGVGMLFVDESFAPWFPFLFFTVMLLAGAGTIELWQLLPAEKRPRIEVILPGVLLTVAFNWWPELAKRYSLAAAPHSMSFAAFGVTLAILAAFLLEMTRFHGPGHAVERIALSAFAFIYLGLLPSYLAQLRFAFAASDQLRSGSIALALAIFTPKLCDIGAYFTGRFLGKHQMSPILSPKKTWEGAVGGLLTSAIGAVLIDRAFSAGPMFFSSPWLGLGFGFVVGLAGLLGDLAESMIKRDCQQKDASNIVPGFGGVLDVVDAILFAAPFAYWGLTGR